MSKTTKVIAALGVVAGLGVAALPAFTYAQTSISGGVNVKAIVDEAIAMTITGNEDTTWQTSAETPVSVTGDSVYAPAGVTTLNTYNAANGEVFVNGTTAVRYASGSYTNILPNSVKNGGTDDADFKSTISVWTNSANGYDLTVIDQDTSNALSNGESGTAADTIAAVDNNGALVAGATNGAWGIKVGTTSTDGTGYSAVPVSGGSALNIKNNGAAFADGEQTVVYYGVATKAAQKTGTYTDQIIYTATTKNGS
ncbi:hypothetical protein J6D24_00790 [Candidatus Saccharibacteria bacterium]|nr:hypothetical protein [Candidatus Saccharibacteria bacterium]